MLLKEIKIYNYRKFTEAKLSFDNDITLLAGANNSGKTSLIELLNHIINGSSNGLTKSDIPVNATKSWIDNAFPIFCSSFSQNLDEELAVKNIISRLFALDEHKADAPILMSQTKVQFTIDYNTEDDDIRNFADYIMDFDPTKKAFYFEYIFKVSSLNFGKLLLKNYKKIKSRYDSIDNSNPNLSKIKSIKEKLIDLYISCIEEKSYFTSSNFQNQNELDIKEFKKLFNFQNICASRNLDDQTTDKSKTLSKNMINLTSHNDAWKTMIDGLPDKILQQLEDENIIKLVQEASINGLSDAIDSIINVNGGNTGRMILDMNISEEVIRTLIIQITNAKYQLDDFTLHESSQGLGYSNMIYILVQLENYRLSINPLLVNMFFIEEPESHMHPQMQNVFAKYIKKYYETQKIQGLITTHSSEIVRVIDMKKLRISRSLGHFNCTVIDFKNFKNDIKSDEVLDNFYDWFFEVGFSEIVFADRVIMYEGDTERMLIRKLSTYTDFEKLNQLYIAFVQVGGAYAYNYKKLITFLQVKTLIITDLDYDKKAKSEVAIKTSTTTNSTINNFYKDNNLNTLPKVLDLYEWKAISGNIVLDHLVYLCYQGTEDGYSRTLEEAMLAKHYGITAFKNKNRTSWLTLRENDKLKYTIPNKKGNYNIRDLVAHTSNTKTDFMYSVILNNFTSKMLPHYIKEGLTWLIQ